MAADVCVLLCMCVCGAWLYVTLVCGVALGIASDPVCRAAVDSAGAFHLAVWLQPVRPSVPRLPSAHGGLDTVRVCIVCGVYCCVVVHMWLCSCFLVEGAVSSHMCCCNCGAVYESTGTATPSSRWS